jgi:hypothetical protein
MLYVLLLAKASDLDFVGTVKLISAQRGRCFATTHVDSLLHCLDIFVLQLVLQLWTSDLET